MSYERLQVGDIEVLALVDGVQDLDDDPMSSAFPDWPEGAHEESRARYPGVYGPGDQWRITIRAWLVRHPGGTLLVDTGIGRKGSSPSPNWFGDEGALLDVLRDVGTEADSIDAVLITHVHDDHIGGTSALSPDGELVPAFPEARYVLQRADWEWMRDSAKQDEEDAEIWSLLLAPLERAGVVELVDGDRRVDAGIDLHHVPGHTPGHQVVRLESEGSRALLSGDTFNHPGLLSYPDRRAGSDSDHAPAAAGRREMLAELLAHPDTILAPTHFTEAFGTVVTERNGLAIWAPRA